MTKIYKVQMNSKGMPDFSTAVEIPSSDNHDWEKYSDRLWKIAYERGKASVRPQGEWIDRSDGGRILHPWWESCECSQCGEWGSGVWNFCPKCGSRNRKENE